MLLATTLTQPGTHRSSITLTAAALLAALLLAGCASQPPDTLPLPTPIVAVETPTVQPTAMPEPTATVGATLAPTATPESTPTLAPTAELTTTAGSTNDELLNASAPIIAGGDIAALQEVQSFALSVERPYNVSFNDTGYMVLGGGWSQSAKLFDWRTHRQLASYGNDSLAVLSPLSDTIAIASGRSPWPSITIQSINSGEATATLSGYETSYEASYKELTFSPEGSYLAATVAEAQQLGCDPKPLDVWRVDDGQRIASIAQECRNAWSSVFSPAGHWLAYLHVNGLTRKDARVVLLSFPSLQPKWEQSVSLDVMSWTSRLIFADDNHLVVPSATQIYVFDVETGNALRIPITGGLLDIVSTADGSTVLGLVGGSLGSPSHTLRAWDLTTGEILATNFKLKPAGILRLLDGGRVLVTVNWVTPNYDKGEVSLYQVSAGAD